MLAATLHAMAMLLRSCKRDWFINFNASDRPLATQDGIIYASLICRGISSFV